MATVKAVVIRDGAVSWDDKTSPTIGDDELLVRVEAAGINGADILQRAGRYPPPPGIPADMPGLECAGTIEAIGERVSGFRTGERVMGLMAGAAQAELAALHQRLALRVPAGLSPAEAGGFPEVFCTAHDALFSQGSLGIGDKLLVTGAAGGVGMAAVQLGRAAGADVVASVRNPELRGRVEALGAVCAEPAKAVGLGPFDVVLELVGGPGVAQALATLAPWGRYVVIGTGAGSRVEVDLGVVMARRATLRGSTLRNRSLEEKATVVRRVEHHVLPLVASGKVRVVVNEAFPFARAQDAYEHFAAGGKFGKVVLTTGGPRA